MTFAIEKATIENHVKNNLTGTNLVYENQSQPNSVLDWVRVNILNSDSKQVSLGNNPYFRYKGLLIFQIFTKPNIGSGRAMSIADQITTIFRGQKVGTITFRPPVTDKVGENGGWYQVNVSVPFFREEL